MKKVSFFPYHDDLQMLASFKDCLTDWEIVGFLSYKEDRLLIDQLNAQYQTAEKTANEILNASDAIVILDNHRGFQLEKYYQVIEAAIAEDKEVLITPYAASQLELGRYEGQYRLLQKRPDNGLAPYEVCKDKFWDINVPAIAVMGQGKNCGKFECQIFLQTVLCQNNKPVVLSSNSLGAMLGFYTLPEFLFEEIPFEEKVLKMNYYIRAIIQQEKPDVIIIGIPEGIVSADQGDFNRFGEYALVMTSAVTIDLSVLCMYYLGGELNAEGLASVVGFCEERFRIPYVSVFMSNMFYDKSEEVVDPFVYEYLGNEYYVKHHPDFGKLSIHAFSMKDRKRAKNTVLKIVRPLTDNICMV